MARSAIFVSWSGERSREIAEALKEFFGDVLPHTDSWISSDDLRKGARWLPELDGHLRKSTVGVVVVTPENKDAPWLSFEGGVIAGTLAEKRCCPVLCGLDATDLTGPLAQFQATEVTDKDEVLRLVQSINEATGEERDDRVTRWFERSWDALLRQVQATLGKKVAVPRPPTTEELLREILSIVRAPASREMVELISRMVGIQEQFKAQLTGIQSALEVPTGPLRGPQQDSPAGADPSVIYLPHKRKWDVKNLNPTPTTGLDFFVVVPKETSRTEAVIRFFYDDVLSFMNHYRELVWQEDAERRGWHVTGGVFMTSTSGRVNSQQNYALATWLLRDGRSYDIVAIRGSTVAYERDGRTETVNVPFPPVTPWPKREEQAAQRAAFLDAASQLR